jgi:hypothetical protein
MGITPNDIAAQRAMFQRGEEKRKADWKLAERERLRDTFAAAALTGLLSNIQRYQNGALTEQAFEISDFMLKERDRTSAGVAEMDSAADRKSVATPRACASSCSQPFDSAPTTHDAAPDARARDADRGRTDNAVTRPGDGTGNTPSPESYEQGDEKRTNTTTHRGIDRKAYEGDIVSRLRHWRGLHLAHGGKLFDEAADEIDRLREAIRRLADQDATLSVQGGNVTVTMDATLTDEERQAIDETIHAARLS